MIGARKLAEVIAENQDEAMAREGMCPACRAPGFLGVGAPLKEQGGVEFVDVEHAEKGSMLCRFCWVIWWYPLAARRHWN